MAIIKFDDILGIYINGEILCSHCYTQEQWTAVTEEHIITRETVEANSDSYVFFCDECTTMLI